MNLPRPRFTVRLLMLVVVLVAVNFVIVRRMLETSGDIGIAFVTLPMANALFLVAPRVWGGGARRNFWFGFEIAGWLMVAMFGYLSHSHAQDFLRARELCLSMDYHKKYLHSECIFIFSRLSSLHAAPDSGGLARGLDVSQIQTSLIDRVR